ncbi:Sodium channel protein para, partial [Orchesella cincta]
MFKFLSDSTQCEGAKAPNPKYEDGKVLPKKLRTRFLQEAKPCVPLEEIDPYFRNKQTFVVIGRWGTIHRFSSNPDGYFTLGPSNGIRRLAIYLLTNWIFSTFLVAVLLLNAEALMKAQNFEIMRSLDHTWKKSWVVDAMYFIALNWFSNSLLEDSSVTHSWLDVVVIWTGFYPFTSFILTAKSALWLRLFKIIPLIPSIRQACKLSGKALYQLRGMMILGIVLLWFFALLGMELYMGRFTQKCVKEFPQGAKVSDAMWEQHNRNMSNWLIGNQDNNYLTCGNLSGSTACPDGYVCLQGVGPNPDLGQTNFDNIWWSVLSVTRIATEDYTEAIFTLVEIHAMI